MRGLAFLGPMYEKVKTRNRKHDCLNVPAERGGHIDSNCLQPNNPDQVYLDTRTSRVRCTEVVVVVDVGYAENQYAACEMKGLGLLIEVILEIVPR